MAVCSSSVFPMPATIVVLVDDWTFLGCVPFWYNNLTVCNVSFISDVFDAKSYFIFCILLKSTFLFFTYLSLSFNCYFLPLLICDFRIFIDNYLNSVSACVRCWNILLQYSVFFFVLFQFILGRLYSQSKLNFHIGMRHVNIVFWIHNL